MNNRRACSWETKRAWAHARSFTPSLYAWTTGNCFLWVPITWHILHFIAICWRLKTAPSTRKCVYMHLYHVNCFCLNEQLCKGEINRGPLTLKLSSTLLQHSCIARECSNDHLTWLLITFSNHPNHRSDTFPQMSLPWWN